MKVVSIHFPHNFAGCETLQTFTYFRSLLLIADPIDPKQNKAFPILFNIMKATPRTSILYLTLFMILFILNTNIQITSCINSESANLDQEIQNYSIKQLKQLIVENGLTCKHCIEKNDLIRFIIENKKSIKPTQNPTTKGESITDEKLLAGAAITGDVATINSLITKGVSINSRYKNGLTALMLAVHNKQIEAVNTLIQLGADVNIKQDNGVTAFMVASFTSQLDIIRILIKAGAEIDATSNTGSSALIIAVINGETKIIEVLVSLGANIEQADSNSRTPLIMAAMRGQLKIIKKLVDLGANIHAKGNDGMDSLMIATRWGHVNIVQHLIESGANIHTEDNTGMIPLTLAIHYRNDALVEKLIELGANLVTTDNQSIFSNLIPTTIDQKGFIQLLMGVGDELCIEIRSPHCKYINHIVLIPMIKSIYTISDTILVPLEEMDNKLISIVSNVIGLNHTKAAFQSFLQTIIDSNPTTSQLVNYQTIHNFYRLSTLSDWFINLSEQYLLGELSPLSELIKSFNCNQIQKEFSAGKSFKNQVHQSKLLTKSYWNTVENEAKMLAISGNSSISQVSIPLKIEFGELGFRLINSYCKTLKTDIPCEMFEDIVPKQFYLFAALRAPNFTDTHALLQFIHNNVNYQVKLMQTIDITLAKIQSRILLEPGSEDSAESYMSDLGNIFYSCIPNIVTTLLDIEINYIESVYDSDTAKRWSMEVKNSINAKRYDFLVLVESNRNLKGIPAAERAYLLSRCHAVVHSLLTDLPTFKSPILELLSSTDVRHFYRFAIYGYSLGKALFEMLNIRVKNILTQYNLQTSNIAVSIGQTFFQYIVGRNQPMHNTKQFISFIIDQYDNKYDQLVRSVYRKMELEEELVMILASAKDTEAVSEKEYINPVQFLSISLQETVLSLLEDFDKIFLNGLSLPGISLNSQLFKLLDEQAQFLGKFRKEYESKAQHFQYHDEL
jgi:ankyrin repeat protein